MKFSFCILLFLTIFSLQAQTLWEIPPGTIKINDSLYIDKGPVDNLMYLEFTGSVEKFWTYKLRDSLKKLELKNIDKSLLTGSLDLKQNEEIFRKVIEVEDLEIPGGVELYDYFNHPEYLYNPVIGISKEQAELYCTWRSDMVNLLWSTEIDSGNYSKVEYRLPTKEEYIRAKESFRKRNKLLVLKEDSPLKINFEDLRKRENFVLYNIPEITATGKHYKFMALPDDKPGSNANYTFFRCICEVQK